MCGEGAFQITMNQHLATLSASHGSCEQPGVSNGVPSLTEGSAAKGTDLSLSEVPGFKLECLSESGSSHPAPVCTGFSFS